MRALAQRTTAALALRAASARNGPIQQHRLTGPQLRVCRGHVFAHTLDQAGTFVPQHQRPRPLQRGVVGVTDAGGAHDHAHFPRQGRTHDGLIDDETPAAVADSGRAAQIPRWETT
jgi:hypothetical protein